MPSQNNNGRDPDMLNINLSRLMEYHDLQDMTVDEKIDGAKIDLNKEIDKKADIDNPVFTGSISLGRLTRNGVVSTIGDKSFAVGTSVEASGQYSHAEGNTTTASASGCHAEGTSTTASGLYSHAEGHQSVASNTASHAEGQGTTASGFTSHTEGNDTKATTSYAHAEGYKTTASGNASHAEGSVTTASGNGSHAEGGSTTASGIASHAEGNNTKAHGSHCHAEGYKTEAGILDDDTIKGCHAEGGNTKASGQYSHAEGNTTTASGNYSHVEGVSSQATGEASHAEGYATYATATGSHASNFHTIASCNYQTAMGSYNISSSSNSDRLIIGKGSSSDSRSNCFRVTDTGVYASGNYNASGADYAEYFEWNDGNPDNEDRIGHFVSLKENKIQIAQPNDDMIIGIVSGAPSIVGDAYDDQWCNMYLSDIYGRPIWEDVEIPDEKDEEGNIIIPAHTERRQKLNPEYDNSKPYIKRSERPEWDTIGLFGKIVAIDDGTCVPGQFATVGQNGIATYSNDKTRFYVMKRLDETHIRIFILLPYNYC